ncbi:MAG: hypothetical protein MZV63_13390 [Marinilabiliales bacterium]|nr:hypothetical protein [Marinilabiliales bacterium]
MRAADQVVQAGAAPSSSPRAAPTASPSTASTAGSCASRADPQELLTKIRAPGFLEQDQWQAHIQALIQPEGRRLRPLRRPDGRPDPGRPPPAVPAHRGHDRRASRPSTAAAPRSASCPRARRPSPTSPSGMGLRFPVPGRLPHLEILRRRR